MKNTLDGINVLDTAKEKITKCEDIEVVTIQSKTERKEKFFN